MDQQDVIQSAEQYVRQELGSDSSGHDWWHIDRVRRLALELAEREQANAFICELAALLHDIADVKLNESKQAGLDKVHLWLTAHVTERDILDEVMEIIGTMSYNGGGNPPMGTLEGRVVQDADRLDAIGAIGIARTFAYGGSRGRMMYDPESSSGNATIDHFYDKLLRLKDLMNTAYGKELAQSRHEFMEAFLIQFYLEWDFGGCEE
ncbi:HD domain-containing protein [Paenibacillus zeisoli]|uniref:HD domain-containing protein n=1 Tax=Paenibacillus zeisoli TaxID=2496267 RepID=A0A3S1JQA0_9BACL|nr:HD domain-containing protein [Paenibacillus zeisoli]RUT33418.1 HD domain-containing protein [Paenibacillus zeisoli]